MSRERKNIGEIGEEEACKFLMHRGYEIIQRNFRCQSGEIDVIARDFNGDICFVEVKTRRSKKYGLPSEAVTSNKRRHFKRAIEFYLLTHPRYKKENYRADVIEVYLGDGWEWKDNIVCSMEINHIKNIQLEGDNYVF